MDGMPFISRASVGEMGFSQEGGVSNIKKANELHAMLKCGAKIRKGAPYKSPAIPTEDTECMEVKVPDYGLLKDRQGQKRSIGNMIFIPGER